MSQTPYFFVINGSDFYSAYPYPQHTPTTFTDIKQLCKNYRFKSATHRGGWGSTYDPEKAITLSGVTQQASPGIRKQKTSDLQSLPSLCKKLNVFFCGGKYKCTVEGSFRRIKD